jgi:hypothetical protein
MAFSCRWLSKVRSGPTLKSRSKRKKRGRGAHTKYRRRGVQNKETEVSQDGEERSGVTNAKKGQQTFNIDAAIAKPQR